MLGKTFSHTWIGSLNQALLHKITTQDWRFADVHASHNLMPTCVHGLEATGMHTPSPHPHAHLNARPQPLLCQQAFLQALLLLLSLVLGQSAQASHQNPFCQGAPAAVGTELSHTDKNWVKELEQQEGTSSMGQQALLQAVLHIPLGVLSQRAQASCCSPTCGLSLQQYTIGRILLERGKQEVPFSRVCASSFSSIMLGFPCYRASLCMQAVNMQIAEPLSLTSCPATAAA